MDQRPPATAGIHFFGIVQYIGPERSNDWIAFYDELFGTELIPDEQRFGIMPKGTLLRTPALDPAKRFMLQLVEPPLNVHDADEKLQRIGLGVPDVLAAVKALACAGRGVRRDGGGAHRAARRDHQDLPGLGGVRAGAQRTARRLNP